MATLFVLGCAQNSATVPEANGNKTAADRVGVTVRVNFSGFKEDFERNVQLPRAASVFDSLQAALPGVVEFVGTGDTLFIKSISGVSNQGAGKDNWTYRVNGELGDTSCGVKMLDDGDTVEWTLGKYLLLKE